MKQPFLSSLLALVYFVSCSAHGQESSPPRIPQALKAWEGWVLWRDTAQNCPPSYQDPARHFCFWPSTLVLDLNAEGGTFSSAVTIYNKTWIILPGNAGAWPLEVQANGAPVPVLQQGDRPAVLLPAGEYKLQGRYAWNQLPQNLKLPRETGIVRLQLSGQPVESPTWNPDGTLWLRRDRVTDEADQDFLSLKIAGKLEDGIPLWLDTEVELIVAGKSREETIGTVLPEGWKLSQVDSQIPVALDDSGRMKAQVRAGRWTVRLRAFRMDNPKEIRFAANAKPAAEEELIGFQSRPDFRLVEIMGAPVVDVSQTTFPEGWRNLPVYRWDTAAPIQIEERMRGMGEQSASNLSIRREWWLDENGELLTFRDNLTGKRQQIWRLDAAPGQDIGSVRADGEGQLITKNPETGASGVEVRSRAVNLEATGRMQRSGTLSATGWLTNAEGVTVTLNLPPGWRLFALFGADWVRGDWLSAWSLLDMFLLLIFSLAVFRLCGFPVAVLAFFAFALSYQEPQAPRYTWLALLLPLALMRVVPIGRVRTLVQCWKWGTVAVLVVLLTPYLSSQIQQALFPQLERHSNASMSRSASEDYGQAKDLEQAASMEDIGSHETRANAPASSSYKHKLARPQMANAGKASNLFYDSKARIQTGPGVPEWSWRAVSFGWNGPVQDSQTVRPILIPMGLERLLTILRIALLLGLAALLLRKKSGASLPVSPSLPTAAVLVFLACFVAGSAQAQSADFPGAPLLKELRERLLEPSEVFPDAAQISIVHLKLDGRNLHMEAEIHAGTTVAVPLPGKLPAWSPLSVSVDGKAEVVVRREDGFLWIVLEEGIHKVVVEGMIGEGPEWEWAFQLAPRKVVIDAPGWAFSGVQPDGVPEAQIFFVRKQRETGGEALYDRQDFQTLALVERHVELGLVWQVSTTVTRLSSQGKAISLRVPLLPGEKVLTSNAVMQNGMIEVRLGAQEPSYSWQSELPITAGLQLQARADDTWVENWHLVVSPIWNVSIAGLAPTYAADRTALSPVWRPWPGELVNLSVSRPEAIPGATMTVNRVTQETVLGQRQKTTNLDIAVRASLGEDFLVELPEAAEITELKYQERALPVRKDGNRVIVPLQPGDQTVKISWRTNQSLGLKSAADSVRLPVESANINASIGVPNGRWVLWTAGPLRGPAVRFWTIIAGALLAAWVLGRLPNSPLHTVEWGLLAIGLTQTPLPAALVVVGWLFILVWRGQTSCQQLRPLIFNTVQVGIVGVTLVTLLVFIAVVAAGLLGNPEMFIVGNGSSQNLLKWFQARSETLLPQPACWSVSIWWYRLLMLAWALWLAASLIRWMRWAWTQFSLETCWKKTGKTPPPIPVG